LPVFAATGGAAGGRGGEYVARWFWVPIALNTRRALGAIDGDAGLPVEVRRKLAVALPRLLVGWAARAKHLDSWRAWSGRPGRVRTHATTACTQCSRIIMLGLLRLH